MVKDFVEQITSTFKNEWVNELLKFIDIKEDEKKYTVKINNFWWNNKENMLFTYSNNIKELNKIFINLYDIFFIFYKQKLKSITNKNNLLIVTNKIEDIKTFFDNIFSFLEVDEKNIIYILDTMPNLYIESFNLFLYKDLNKIEEKDSLLKIIFSNFWLEKQTNGWYKLIDEYYIKKYNDMTYWKFHSYQDYANNKVIKKEDIEKKLYWNKILSWVVYSIPVQDMKVFISGDFNYKWEQIKIFDKKIVKKEYIKDNDWKFKEKTNLFINKIEWNRLLNNKDSLFDYSRFFFKYLKYTHIINNNNFDFNFIYEPNILNFFEDKKIKQIFLSLIKKYKINILDDIENFNYEDFIYMTSEESWKFVYKFYDFLYKDNWIIDKILWHIIKKENATEEFIEIIVNNIYKDFEKSFKSLFIIFNEINKQYDNWYKYIFQYKFFWDNYFDYIIEKDSTKKLLDAEKKNNKKLYEMIKDRKDILWYAESIEKIFSNIFKQLAFKGSNSKIKKLFINKIKDKFNNLDIGKYKKELWVDEIKVELKLPNINFDFNKEEKNNNNSIVSLEIIKN